MSDGIAPAPASLTTTCCIAGGGPAGMVLGLLLARAGIEVVVLEKHKDFLRDFRGDTIHPSTLEVMDELGLLDELLKLPHNQVSKLGVQIGATTVGFADFSSLPKRYAFIALMPQWDFLDFIATKARAYPNFKLIMQADVVDLIEERGRTVGVRAQTADGPVEVRAYLTVGCDGRKSTVRAKADLPVEDIGAPIDVFWMRISRHPGDPPTGGRIDAGSFFAVLDRGDYFQLAYVIPKGGAERIKAGGLAAFRQIVAKALPFLAERVDELKSWDDVKLLSVSVDRLRTWYRPGLLCIGDAAHA
ncbi:MAG: FAD-dependent oxidoreductase, partial [Hyphomicrobium sp.]